MLWLVKIWQVSSSGKFMQHLETCLPIAEADSFVSSCDVFYCLFPVDVQNKIQPLSMFFCYLCLVCLLVFWLRNAPLAQVKSFQMASSEGAGREVWNLTWSPLLRNLSEWDWVPVFLQNKYGGDCRHGRAMSFCSVLSFPASKHQERFSWTFLIRNFWTSRGMMYMYERFIGDFTFPDSASRQVQLFIGSVNFTSDQPAQSLIFFHLQRY